MCPPAPDCETQGGELATMKAKLLASLGRSREAEQLLNTIQEAEQLLNTTTNSIQEADSWLIQAIIYRTDNKLGKLRQQWKD